MTAALGHILMRHPDVKGSMEQFLVQHVIPEFASSEPYIRAIVRQPPTSDITLTSTHFR